jgi:hypothetical protein
VIAEPPFVAGAVKDTVAWPSPAVAVTPVGALGTIETNAANAYLVAAMADTSLVSDPLTPELSPPLKNSPHVTTEPSTFRTANAESVAAMADTPLVSDPLTPELFPPLELSPHVTTEPSLFRAANA